MSKWRNLDLPIVIRVFLLRRPNVGGRCHITKKYPNKRRLNQLVVTKLRYLIHINILGMNRTNLSTYQFQVLSGARLYQHPTSEFLSKYEPSFNWSMAARITGITIFAGVLVVAFLMSKMVWICVFEWFVNNFCVQGTRIRRIILRQRANSVTSRNGMAAGL